ncbi:MAG: YfhO family protein [Acidobacteriota bacterium]
MRTFNNLLRNLFTGNRAYVLSLILLNCFFFGDVLFTEKTFFYRDIGNFHQPLKKLVTEAYAQGHWPLWNPYIQFGQPLLANPNAMAVYPTQMLFHLLPFNLAFDLDLVLHCLIGGLGVFYLARALNLTPMAAFAGAVAYNFNGVMVSFIDVPLLVVIAGLLPWLALLTRKVVRGPSPANLALCSVLFGLLLLLLEPLTTYAVLLFLVPFAFGSFLTRPAGVSARRVLVGLTIVLVSAFCLAGLQIFPTLELIENSGRKTGLVFETVSFWSVHPLSLTQMLFPNVWKDTFSLMETPSAGTTAFFGAPEAYVISCYAGLSCLMMALLGLLFSRRRRLKWTLFAMTLAALVLALGKYTPVYSFLFNYVPPFRLGRYPAKYLLTTSICFSLLAALGIDQLRQLGERFRLVLYFGLVGGLLLGAVLLAGDWAWQAAGFQVAGDVITLTYQGEPVDLSLPLLRQSILYLAVVVCAGLLLVFFAATGSRKRPSWIAVATTALIFFDLLTNHLVNPLIRADAYEPSPVTQWLLARTSTGQICRIYHLSDVESPYRVLGKTNSFIWNFLFYRLIAAPYTAAGDHLQYSSFLPIDRLETLTSQVIHGQIRQARDLGQRLDYLAQLNTGYILSMNPVRTPLLEWQVSFDLNSDRPLHIYRLKTAYPRAYLADLQVERTSQGHYLPAKPGPTQESARVVKYNAGEVDLWANPGRPSMLVLLDSYYPGWRVWVDGRECKIEMVNWAFRGVIVPPGPHRVTFRYDPRSFRLGLALTLATMAAWVAVFIVLHARTRR